jgi:hypothetical protein
MMKITNRAARAFRKAFFKRLSLAWLTTLSERWTMIRLAVLLFLITASTSLAQAAISGTLYSQDVNGVFVIGCLLDVATSDCNYQKSLYIAVNPDGSYTLGNLEPGQYLVIAWRDTNSSGQLEKEDELVYYRDASGQAIFISPPAIAIDFHLGAKNTSPSPAEDQLIGQWYNGLGNGLYIRYQFTNIGTYMYSTPLKIISGTFTVENDQLTLKASDGTTESYTLQFECIGRGSFSEYLTLRDNATHLETPYVRDPTDPGQRCKEE